MNIEETIENLSAVSRDLIVGIAKLEGQPGRWSDVLNLLEVQNHVVIARNRLHLMHQIQQKERTDS